MRGAAAKGALDLTELCVFLKVWDGTRIHVRRRQKRVRVCILPY